MITLFRRVREQLIASGSVTKYLIYAAGEIMLVVIGILLALQINNWNQDRLTDNQEKYLLIELEKEYVQNLSAIEDDININKQSLSATIHLIEGIQSRELLTAKMNADSLIAYVNNISGFDPVSGVIDDIINTGKLEVIRNDSLRYLLANWGEQVSDLYDDNNIRSLHLFEFIIPYLSKNYPLANTKPYFEKFSYLSKGNWEQWKNVKSSTPIEDRDALLSSEFESLLFYHGINQEYVLTNSQNYKEYLLSVLKLIEEEKEN